MAKIQRKTQKIFGQNGNTDEFAQFGTMKLIENGGNPTYSKDVEVLQNNAAYLIGWQNAVIAGYAPFLEELNTICYTLTYQMAYLLQNGIPEWDDGTTYYINSIVVGSDSKIYRCKTDNCLNVNPTTDDGTNWYDYELNAANLDLSNISNIGKAFVNNSKALETGSISDNATIYADILKYAHSTFDSSKFTAVGTPTISDDGIVSNLSINDFVHISSTVPTLTNTNGWDVTTPLYQVNSITQQDNVFYYYSGTGATLNRIALGFKNDGTVLVLIGTNNYVDILRNNTLTYTANDTFQFRFIHEGTTYSAYYKKNNSDWTLLQSQENTASFSIASFDIGSSFGGTLDLKGFSIKADGNIYINANKTGIDTIKPDDYLIAGSPTITNGIVTGLSNSNYLEYRTLPALTNSNFWEVVSPVYTPNANNIDNSGVFRFITGTTTNGFTISFTTAGNIVCILQAPSFTDITRVTIPYTSGNNYQFKWVHKAEGSYQCYYRINGGAWTLGANKTGDTLTIDTTGQYTYFGINGSNVTMNMNGMYAEIYDSIVYQPCLYIPYSQSKTGSKVVDVSARANVENCYKSNGIAPYYTIDEVNANFTLPMGEIYGMKIDKTTPHIVENYRNGASWYRVWSDGLIEQGGDLTLGTNSYTFVKSYSSIARVFTQLYTNNTAAATNAGVVQVNALPTTTGFTLSNLDSNYWEGGYWFARGY